MGKLDLKTFKFPDAEMYPTTDTNFDLLEEAKKRNYLYGNKSGNKLFSAWFFNGVKEIVVKDLDNAEKAFKYMRTLMGSFSPKHEHKEAVCAMIIDEFLVITLKPKKAL